MQNFSEKLDDINALELTLSEIYALANALAVGAVTEDGKSLVFTLETLSVLAGLIMDKAKAAQGIVGALLD